MEPFKTQNQDTYPLPSGREASVEFREWKTFVDELKRQWKHLWWSRIDDKMKAEGIASNEFPNLFVEKGTVIIATKDYKPPSFQEILEVYVPKPIVDRVNPSPATGGMGKFIKKTVKSQRNSRREPPSKLQKPKNQHQKHGGRGWLHHSLE